MINDAIDYIRYEVTAHLGVTKQQVIVGPAQALTDQSNLDTALITLLNVQEDAHWRNTFHVERMDGQVDNGEPRAPLELFLLFAFKFQSYSESLIHLSKTLELFRSKPVLAADNAHAMNPFPTTLEKLVLTQRDLSLEELGNLWSLLGSTYVPSVAYYCACIQRND